MVNKIPKSNHRYVIFHKPYDVLSSFTDPAERPTLASYIPIPEVYAAGRLDRDSEGLLLLTSDGQLIHRMTDPRFKVWKSYWAQVERVPSTQALAQLRDGVRVKGTLTRPANVRLLSPEPSVWPRPVPIRYRKAVPTAWLEIQIMEGLNRQIRRMTSAVGHPTLRLIRMAIGPVRLESLEPGEWRDLRPEELHSLISDDSRVPRGS